MFEQALKAFESYQKKNYFIVFLVAIKPFEVLKCRTVIYHTYLYCVRETRGYVQIEM